MTVRCPCRWAGWGRAPGPDEAAPAGGSLSAPGRRRRGQSTVEFALLLPLLCALAFTATDVSRAMSAKTDVVNAAREAARAASLPETGNPAKDTCTDHDIWAAAMQESPSLPWPSLPACPSTPVPTTATCALTIAPAQADGRGSSPNTPVTVAVSCPFTLVTPFAKGLLGTPTVGSSAVAEDQY